LSKDPSLHDICWFELSQICLRGLRHRVNASATMQGLRCECYVCRQVYMSLDNHSCSGARKPVTTIYNSALPTTASRTDHTHIACIEFLTRKTPTCKAALVMTDLSNPKRLTACVHPAPSGVLQPGMQWSPTRKMHRHLPHRRCNPHALVGPCAQPFT
jgi:hypothetical protein